MCVCVYIYLPRCTLVTGWIDLSRRSNIGFSFGGRANSEPPPICSCARRGSAWLRYADCWLEKLTDGGGRSSREARRAFPRSLLFFPFSLSISLFLSIEVRYDTTWWVGFGGPQPAIWLSNRGLSVPSVRLGQYQFRGIVAWQVFKQLIQDRFLWYIRRSNFSIVGTMNSKSYRPID